MSPHHRRSTDPLSPPGSPPPAIRPVGKWERRLWAFERVWQDVVPAVCIVLLILLFVSTSGDNADRVDDVQASRYEFQLQSCIATNARNLAAKAKAREVVSAQGQRSVRILIDALVPFTRDCEARAREGVEIPPD
jgi:hypothetical protein